MQIRFYIITIILNCFYCSCTAQNNQSHKVELFSACSSTTEDSMVVLEHQLFTIKYPAHWKHDKKLKQGLDISSNEFPDALKRGFTLSVVPFKEYYLTQNPSVDYHKFTSGLYKDYQAIYLIRNDLYPNVADQTVYWRSELKLVNKAENLLYILVFGLRHDKENEPDWCMFKNMIQSLKIHE